MQNQRKSPKGARFNRADFIRQHRLTPNHRDIIVCTVAEKILRQALGIHDALKDLASLTGSFLG